jgi:Holliday junction resolvase RusA-like endonuclease
MIRIVLNGPPVPKGRPRFGKGHAYTPAKTRNFEKDLAWAAKIAMQGRMPLEGPVRIDVSVDLLPKARKADIDNYLKSAMDPLNGIVWKDDSQVVSASISRYIDHENPRLEIEVVPL